MWAYLSGNHHPVYLGVGVGVARIYAGLMGRVTSWGIWASFYSRLRHFHVHSRRNFAYFMESGSEVGTQWVMCQETIAVVRMRKMDLD